MQKYIYIFIGSFIGAALRYSIKGIHIFEYHGKLPLNTLIINFLGAFFLAFFLTVAYEILEFKSDIRLGISIGLVGAFTTFSTLCKETVNLMNSGDYFYAISYIILSAALGLGAIFAGTVITHKMSRKLTNRKAKSDA